MGKYLVIGAGLTGSVIARVLHDAGKNVTVIDRRSHIAGNIHDHTHRSGIRIHTYGPHYFRTNDEKIWKFVNRFSEFYRYEPAIKSLVDGKLENWPIANSYILSTVGAEWKAEFNGQPRHFEEAALCMMPRIVYEKFVKGYTEKQWGVPASKLSANLIKRFDVHDDDDPRLMRHKYQGIPVDGYARMIEKMLEGISVELNIDYLKSKENFNHQHTVIFTGAIDEYFEFDMGKLLYRGQIRHDEYHENTDYFQPCGQVNNPDPLAGSHIRTLEWKHMMDPQYVSRIPGTVVTRETPFTPSDPNQYEYPFPDDRNRKLYNRYRERADRLDNVLICGRLGEYRYYDMDQAIARAWRLTERILTPNRME